MPGDSCKTNIPGIRRSASGIDVAPDGQIVSARRKESPYSSSGRNRAAYWAGPGLPKEPDFLDYLRRRTSEVRLTELAKRRSRGDSAGLGLVVAQRVAEAHKGVVDAYNLSQGGAAFCLVVPVHEGASCDDVEVAG